MKHDDFSLSPADLAKCAEIPGIREDEKPEFEPAARRVHGMLVHLSEQIGEFCERFPDYDHSPALAGLSEFADMLADNLANDCPADDE